MLSKLLYFNLYFCVLGEGSITTVYSNPVYEKKGTTKDFAPPPRMVPSMMKHLMPNVKIIVMLRNPVDRSVTPFTVN